MLKPEIVKIPDYSQYVGKEFVITKGINWLNHFGISKEKLDDYENEKLSEKEVDEIEEIFEREYPNFNLYEGMKFKITKIKKNIASIKITSSQKECQKSIEDRAKEIAQGINADIEKFDKIISWWENEPELFVVDEDSFWNKRDGDNDQRGGHCINTSYNGIPADHPDKYGMAKAYYNSKGEYSNDDSIMTMDYKRTDGRVNIYSYQSGDNVFYSKTCYEFMRLGKIEDAESYNSKEGHKKLYKWMKSTEEIEIDLLNEMEFKEVK